MIYVCCYYNNHAKSSFVSRELNKNCRIKNVFSFFLSVPVFTVARRSVVGCSTLSERKC